MRYLLSAAALVAALALMSTGAPSPPPAGAPPADAAVVTYDAAEQSYGPATEAEAQALASGDGDGGGGSGEARVTELPGGGARFHLSESEALTATRGPDGKLRLAHEASR